MTFIDFFSGIGGFRLGLTMAGHTCVGHCEIDKFADRSYRAMYEPKEGEWFEKDITKVSAEELPDTDMFVGGFPCQSFSIAGKGLGFRDTRGTLIFEVLRLAKARKPKILLLENVKRLITHEQGRTFATILNGLCELGYCVEWQIFNSKNFGVPQNRERVYIIASLGGACTGKIFPIFGTGGSDIKRLIGGRQGRRVYDSNGAAITLMAGGGGVGAKTGLYSVAESKSKIFIDLVKNKGVVTTENARCIMARYNSGITKFGQSSGVLEVPDGIPCPALTPRRIKKRQNGSRFREPEAPMFTLTSGDVHGVVYVNNATKKGYAEAYVGDSINLAFLKSKERRGRVGKDCANTLDTGCKQGTLTKFGRIRRLTPLECFRLQGFPDELFNRARAVNSDNQLYRQAGNSVTVNVVYEIGKKLKENEVDIL